MCSVFLPGDIGGQMGLFIGASILTILELFDYLYEVRASYKMNPLWLWSYVSIKHKIYIKYFSSSYALLFITYTVKLLNVTWHNKNKKFGSLWYSHRPYLTLFLWRLVYT